jgi:hypothetical protein
MRPSRRSLAPDIVFAGVRLRDISATCIFNVIIDSFDLKQKREGENSNFIKTTDDSHCRIGFENGY